MHTRHHQQLCNHLLGVFPSDPYYRSYASLFRNYLQTTSNESYPDNSSCSTDIIPSSRAFKTSIEVVHQTIIVSINHYCRSYAPLKSELSCPNNSSFSSQSTLLKLVDTGYSTVDEEMKMLKLTSIYNLVNIILSMETISTQEKNRSF